jgi:hypothetical protein
MRAIVSILWGNRHEFEISEVVEHIETLAPSPKATQASAPEQAKPVGKIIVRGRLHDYQPGLPAFDLPDGEHPIYTLATPPQPAAAKATEDAGRADLLRRGCLLLIKAIREMPGGAAAVGRLARQEPDFLAALAKQKARG